MSKQNKQMVSRTVILLLKLVLSGQGMSKQNKQMVSRTVILPLKLVLSGQGLCGSQESFVGQWLWLSWQSSWFRHQRSAVRIPSFSKFLLNIVYCQLYWKDENTEKMSGNGPFKKIKFRKDLHSQMILLPQFWRNMLHPFWQASSVTRCWRIKAQTFPKTAPKVATTVFT